MPNHEVKNMSTSKEVRKFSNGKVELVDIAGQTVGRFGTGKGMEVVERHQASSQDRVVRGSTSTGR